MKAVHSRRRIEFDALMEATTAFAASCASRDPKMIPHPSTWLNGERWLDDVQKSTGNSLADFDWNSLK